MSQSQIRFDDGAAYERFMGQWSRLAGTVFLEWLQPPPGLRWADIGCGNGAFTELLFDKAGAAHVEGVDPSRGQLDFARSRLKDHSAGLHEGTAAQLPFADGSFDAAVMALVIFFVPVPEQGVSEMVRVTRPGGRVCAYAWDIPGGGFPTEPVAEELRRAGITPLRPPRADVSASAALAALWDGAGLQDVSLRSIGVERTFASFGDFWSSVRGAPSLADALDKLPPPELARLQDAVQAKLRSGSDGTVRCRARANAVSGRKPG